MRKTIKLLLMTFFTQAMCCSLSFAGYPLGYQWDWKSDFVLNKGLVTPENPAADDQGVPGVWGYTYNTNGAALASVRVSMREDMGIAVHNSASLIWAQNTTAEWGQNAYVRGTPDTGVWLIAPDDTSGGTAQLGQLVWVAPTGAIIRIHGTIEHTTSVGNGVAWYIDATTNATTFNLTSGSVYFSTNTVDSYIEVAQGDEVVFSVDAQGGAASDGVDYNVVYEVVDAIPDPVYDLGYIWDWKSDFWNNKGLSTPVNPAADSKGESVWSYTYNTNGAESASVRFAGRTFMQVMFTNSITLVWGQGPSSVWGQAAYIRGTKDLDVWGISPEASEGTGTNLVAHLGQLGWTAPADVRVHLFGAVSHESTDGNGVLWYIDAKREGAYTELASGIANNSTNTINLSLSVLKGDEILFSVDGNGGTAGDLSRFDVVYEVVSNVSDYVAWKGSWGVDIGSDTDNPDGDKLNNLAEYALGGDPTNSANIGYIPVSGIEDLGGESNRFVYVYKERTSSNRGISYFLELSPNLIYSSWTNMDYTVVGYGEEESGFRDVTNTTTMGVPTKYIKLIVRPD